MTVSNEAGAGPQQRWLQMVRMVVCDPNQQKTERILWLERR